MSDFAKRLPKIATIGIVLALVALLLNAWFSYRNMLEMHDRDSWVQHTHSVIEHLQRLQAAVIETVTGERGYLLQKDAVFLESVQTSKRTMIDEAKNVASLTTDNPTQQQKISGIQRLIDERFREDRQSVTESATRRCRKSWRCRAT